MGIKVLIPFPTRLRFCACTATSLTALVKGLSGLFARFTRQAPYFARIKSQPFLGFRRLLKPYDSSDYVCARFA